MDNNAQCAWMRRTMRRLALEVDPEEARLTVLAKELGVTLQTVLRWMDRGNMPSTRAEHIEKRFGKTLAPSVRLTGGGKR